MEQLNRLGLLDWWMTIDDDTLIGRSTKSTIIIAASRFQSRRECHEDFILAARKT